MRRLAATLLALTCSVRGVRSAHAQGHPAQSSFPMPGQAASQLPAPTPNPPGAGWRNSTVLGLSSGLGSPYGLLGAFVGFFPFQHLQLEVGGGYSTSFGPAVSALGRVGFNPGDSSFLALGIGLSTNFTDYQYLENCEAPGNGLLSSRCAPPGAPRLAEGSANPIWLNVEASEDVRLGRSVGGRIAAGAGFLLNPGGFPAALGCASEGLGQTPCEVGASRSRDEITWLLHVRIDLYAVIVQGDP
ncbi:MAG: hypothetical protein EPO40_23305 [Myxococcaceae bacterium]|nr:MAG: hypothetical protein EPO40_23305 [Myxococcaceae bacterium]